MRTFSMKLLFAGLICLSAALTQGRVQAQVIWGGEYERYFRPGGAYVPYDGQTYSTQYGYNTGQAFVYPFSGSMSAGRLWSLDYEDRVARALKFGYAMPPEPTPSEVRPRGLFGLGLGFFSRR